MKTEKSFQFSPSWRMLDALARAGYSDTRARRAVVRALCELPARATPAELLRRGRRHHRGLGQVTVYRTLEILDGLGLVRRLHPDGGVSYAAAASAHGHHVICTRCHGAVEFEGCAIEPLLASVRRQTGFTVLGHNLELFGLCPDCRPAGARA
jgi:Fur family transcriptional regulator, ferric uptake regulator